jgi:hypothetical protein
MFITCSFTKDGSGRAYTYAFDLPDEISTGDPVVVMSPNEGEKIVTVVDVDAPEPKFACKPVLRVHVPDDETEPAGPDIGDGHEGDGGTFV